MNRDSRAFCWPRRGAIRVALLLLDDGWTVERVAPCHAPSLNRIERLWRCFKRQPP